jgi:hypothetical protein
VWCNCGVDYKRALRLVGDGQRVLTEGNARIERQRAIIAKLERLESLIESFIELMSQVFMLPIFHRRTSC